MLKTVVRLVALAVALSAIPAGAYAVEAESVAALISPAHAPPQARSRGSRALPSGSVKLEAQSVAAAAGLDCRVANATSLGQDLEGRAVYEVTCGSGPGYLLHDANPPRSYDCLALAGQAEASAARDPAAPSLPTCRMTANRDVLGALRDLALEAGIACDVDQGTMAGQTPSGGRLYEIGCADADGYWLERTATGWTVTECLVVRAQDGACRFSSEAEGAATVRAWLGDAPPCDVTRARYMGGNADGAFYEIGCAAGAGHVARLDAARTVREVLPCADAVSVGGGCVWTEASGAPRI